MKGPPPAQVSRRGFGTALWRLADLVQAADRRRSFRARAFRRAVWSLDWLSSDLSDSAEEMAAVDGIGPGIIRLAEEYRSTGTLAELDRLSARFPADVAWLSPLPRVTPGRLEEMKRGLGIDTTADLLAAIETDALSIIEGIGPTTAERWATILSLPPSPNAVPAHRAAVAAGRLRNHLEEFFPDDRFRIAGEVRRMEEWVSRVDVIAITEDPARLVLFLEETATAMSSAVEPGWAIDLITHDRIPVAVRLSDGAAAGTALVRWTGPAEHVAALGLDETEVSHATEKAVYAAAGSAWVPAPARGRTETSRGFVLTDDLRGDLHVHSDWSPDGHMTLEGIAEAAIGRGYQYIAVTDHTIGLRFGGLDAAALGRQRQDIEALRTRFPELHILHGAEINIDRHGVPDLDDDTLHWLDIVVAGCHSHFDLPRDEQTARLVAAVRHPAIDVLAHPIGRRIGIRPGFDVDLSAVFEAAAETGTALEVNGHRDRMDLSSANAELAATAGVGLVADSDGHRYEELSNVGVAVGVLQRAGVPPDRVVNTVDLDGFLAWLDRDR